MKMNLIKIITYEYLNELLNTHIQCVYLFIYLFTNSFNEVSVIDFTHVEITLG
jgi:hypothetical protein